MRLEHMQTLRREALIAGMTDTGAIWEHVWSRAVHSDRFWAKQFTEPAMLVLSHSAALQSMVGGDASIGGTAGSFSQAPPPPPQPQPSGGGGSNGAARQRGGGNRRSDQRNVKTRVHTVGEDGRLRTNRKGKDLCSGFQSGACMHALPGTYICAVDRRSAHQCARCLDHRHGADNCGAPPAKQPTQPTKGKGKSAGKGGRRGPY